MTARSHRPDARFRISANQLARMAFESPGAWIEIDNTANVAYIHGYPVAFWADLEPVTA